MAKMTLPALIPSRFTELITEKRPPPKSVAAPQQESHAHPLKYRGNCPNPDNRRGVSWNVGEDSPKGSRAMFVLCPSPHEGRERQAPWKHQPLPGHPVHGPFAQWTALTYCSCGFDGSISVEPLFYSLQEPGFAPMFSPAHRRQELVNKAAQVKELGLVPMISLLLCASGAVTLRLQGCRPACSNLSQRRQTRS